jgi:integration host factor subunit alpha
MTKADISEDIYQKIGFSKREVAKIVECVFDIIKETLQQEDKITISGFGIFIIRKKRLGEVEVRREETTLKSLLEGS